MGNQKQSNWKKEAWQWIGIMAVIGLLYGTGWHTEISGKLQQAILWTGIIQAETELPAEEQVQVDFDMPLVTLGGQKANLIDFKGKVIFLNFWASWCPPCIAEMPSIQSLYEKYEDNESIKFVMISLDEDPEKAKGFMQNNGYTFGSYRPAGRQPAEFNSNVIPTTYVINKKGKLVIKKRGMANYNTIKFRSFFKSLAND